MAPPPHPKAVRKEIEAGMDENEKHPVYGCCVSRIPLYD
jgi:hypothetical protein